MDLQQIITIILSVVAVTGTDLEEASGWQPYYFENHKFIPILGDCYQLYHNHDLTFNCRREPELENQSCIHWIQDQQNCLGLITPANETVVFSCIAEIRFDSCFKVYDINRNVSIVCQQQFEGVGVGITTPSNFTLLFYNYFCRTATNLMERQVFSNFVNSFSLDVDARSCYKVYNQREVVSPYNCLSSDIYDACVFSAARNCTGLITQNNEVLILDCPDKSQNHRNPNCFYLYSSDNQVHTVCQIKVEKRCVGVVTPSNLTVLFECFFCSDFGRISYYNVDRQRSYRRFVKNHLADEYNEKKSHLSNMQYKFQHLESLECLENRTYWIPKTSCLGLTLERKETILLDCVVQSEKPEAPGCFYLTNPGEEKQVICTKVLNEACVGLITRKNWSVPLACYPTYNTCFNIQNKEFEGTEVDFLPVLSNFITNKAKIREELSFLAYKEKENVESSLHEPSVDREYLHVQRIDGKEDCLGLVTENEVILLQCPSVKMENGCFGVIKRRNTSSGGILNNEVGNVCIKILDKNCVGILTPGHWTISLSCVHKALAGASSFSETSGTHAFLSNIPDNIPPRKFH